MNFTNDITIQYLEKICDDLGRENSSLINSVKSNSSSFSDNEKKKNNIMRQISLINSINMSIIKLRNLRSKMAEL